MTTYADRESLSLAEGLPGAGDAVAEFRVATAPTGQEADWKQQTARMEDESHVRPAWNSKRSAWT